MSRWGFLVVLAVVASGCTRVIDNPQAKPEPAVAPITALQFSDLLSPHVHGGEGNLFVSVDPDRCGGVAREVNPPFIASHGPIATDGGHWEAESENAYIEELVAVYRSDFDSGNALATARQTIESCRGTPIAVTTMQGRTYTFNLRPPTDSGPQNSVLWSLRASDWRCDNAFVAAHNAAIELTTCGPLGGFDVASAAQDALKRIETLADTTV
jgi:PknH-like extracellular domain